MGGGTGPELMEPLDGNAIAGLLCEAFGAEMTTAVGVCARCGARAPAAELRVYLRGPGAVGRCRNCDAILMAISQIRGVACVDLGGLASLEPEAEKSRSRTRRRSQLRTDASDR